MSKTSQESVGLQSLSTGRSALIETVVLILGLEPGTFGSVKASLTTCLFSEGKSDFTSNLMKAFLTGSNPNDLSQRRPRMLMSMLHCLVSTQLASFILTSWRSKAKFSLTIAKEIRIPPTCLAAQFRPTRKSCHLGTGGVLSIFLNVFCWLWTWAFFRWITAEPMQSGLLSKRPLSSSNTCIITGGAFSSSSNSYTRSFTVQNTGFKES